MEFKALKNIESAFRYVRLFTATVVVSCTAVTAISVWKALEFAERQREKIYVLDEGKSLILALSQDVAQNRPAEAKEHVRRFHELFFTLSPEKSAIEGNVGRALLMADNSAVALYRDLLERGYYNRLIAGNVIQNIVIDSIKVDLTQYPYDAETYARQRIIRESTITERTLYTTCRLVNTARSDDNPQGFMLEGITITENNDIATYDR